MAGPWEAYQAAPESDGPWSQFKPAAPSGPQPSTADRITASPLGRFAHEAIGRPFQAVLNGAQNAIPLMAGMMNPSTAVSQVLNPGTTQGFKPMTDKAAADFEGQYQGALSRNRNTPGYADARAKADTLQNGLGYSMADEFIAPLTAPLAGLAALPGGFDASNAAADSQAAAQQDFQARRPVLSAIGQIGGGFMAGPGGAAARVPAQALPRISNAKPFAEEAAKAGYVLPPRMMTDKPGVVADTMAAWSGKVKTAQSASAKNQEVTNSLTARSIGLPDDTVLTDQVIKAVRSNAGKAYERIPKTLPKVTVDPDFYAQVNKLGEKSSAAAGEFPELLENAEIDKLVKSLSGKTEFSTDAGIALVRKLRKDASTNFKSMGDPAKADLAFAQRDAAAAIEDLIERRLELTGNANLVDEYKQARQIIAKTHDIEAATNTSTGNVSAKKIGALANKGRPFTGDLRTVADTSNAFPKAMQSEAAFGEVEPLSVLDIAAGAASFSTNPSLLGAVLGRPIARGALLSGPMQRRMMGKAANGGRSPLLQAPQLPASGAMPYGLLGSGLPQQGQ